MFSGCGNTESPENGCGHPKVGVANKISPALHACIARCPGLFSHKLGNYVNGTVARICKAAGIEGFKTNHSLRATAATRLYHAGVDEQIIMEITSHRSLDGVRSYKRTSAQQKEAISDNLSSTKRLKPVDHCHEPETSPALTQNKAAIHQDKFKDVYLQPLL